MRFFLRPPPKGSIVGPIPPCIATSTPGLPPSARRSLVQISLSSAGPAPRILLGAPPIYPIPPPPPRAGSRRRKNGVPARLLSCFPSSSSASSSSFRCFKGRGRGLFFLFLFFYLGGQGAERIAWRRNGWAGSILPSGSWRCLGIRVASRLRWNVWIPALLSLGGGLRSGRSFSFFLRRAVGGVGEMAIASFLEG